MVDLSNQYHMFVLKNKNDRIPFGFQERAVSTAECDFAPTAKQRPFDGTHEKPDDELSKQDLDDRYLDAARGLAT